jgi:hypothetical protein
VIAHDVRRSIAQISRIARHLRYCQSVLVARMYSLFYARQTLCGLYEYKESGRSPVPPSNRDYFRNVPAGFVWGKGNDRARFGNGNRQAFLISAFLCSR